MRQIFIYCLVVASLMGCKPTADPLLFQTGFEGISSGAFIQIILNDVDINVSDGNAEIDDRHANSGHQCLHILGGEERVVELDFSRKEGKPFLLSFQAERWTSRTPFLFRIEGEEKGEWKELYNGDEEISVGKFKTHVQVPLKGFSGKKIRFRVSSPQNSGVLIDDLSLLSDAPMVLESMRVPHQELPVLSQKDRNAAGSLIVECKGVAKGMKVSGIEFSAPEIVDMQIVGKVEVYAGTSTSIEKAQLLGEAKADEKGVYKVEGNIELKHGKNFFFVSYTINSRVDLLQKVGVKFNSIIINGKKHKCPENVVESRLGIALRQHWDDSVHTYRIPGLATTNTGALIAVYDIRRNSGVDLQEDIDVGMSRSMDGGQTWEPMKVIMDMGEWGGLSQRENGIGDPSVLVDRATKTIWVAAVWAHGHPGKRNWFASKQGLSPEKTSQFVLVKSTDNGETWSKPINITKQVKDKNWFLLLQGPGKGITMKNGTLVFPAQYKDENQIPHSTIIYSKDHGKSWHIGTGAKPNTTEAQVVELEDGKLMLNMRDNRGGSRSVYVTDDLGKSWKTHATSRKALVESVCMASLHAHYYKGKKYLVFSNPNITRGRHHMTIKVSEDDGQTWPEKYWTLLDEGSGRGYSCLSSIDEETIGILYEGSQSDLTFQKIKFSELLGK